MRDGAPPPPRPPPMQRAPRPQGPPQVIFAKIIYDNFLLSNLDSRMGQDFELRTNLIVKAFLNFKLEYGTNIKVGKWLEWILFSNFFSPLIQKF